MNENQPTNDSESSDLDWQAFRYLSDEMSPDEIVDFETLLSEDQSAREALASAVELTQALAVCGTEETKPLIAAGNTGSNPWLARSLWLALGATAALVLVMVYRGSGSGDIAGGSLTGVDVNESIAVAEKALLWSEIHGEFAESDGLSSLSDESPLLASSEVDAIHFQEAPSWLNAAVMGLRDQDPDNELQEN